MKRTSIILIGLLAFVFSACDTAGLVPPLITGVAPSVVAPGQKFQITGAGFGNPVDDAGALKPGFAVYMTAIGGEAAGQERALRFSFNENETDVLHWDGLANRIIVIAPVDLVAGSYEIAIERDGDRSNPFPLVVRESVAGEGAASIVGWVTHDGVPAALSFRAEAYGPVSDPSAWVLTTEDFGAEPTAGTVVFEFGLPGWDVQFHDVSAHGPTQTAYLAYSAVETGGGRGVEHTVAVFNDFAIPASEYAVGAGPVQLSDWGPVAALGLGDRSLSLIDPAAGNVADQRLLGQRDPDFEPLGFYGGEVTDGPDYMLIAGNSRKTGLGRLVVLFGAGMTEQHSIDVEEYRLSGLITASGQHVLAVGQPHVTDTVSDVDVSENQELLHFHFHQKGPEHNFHLNFHMDPLLAGAVVLPDGVDARAITWLNSRIWLSYASEASDGVLMVHNGQTMEGRRTFKEAAAATVVESKTGAASIPMGTQTVAVPIGGGDGYFYAQAPSSVEGNYFEIAMTADTGYAFGASVEVTIGDVTSTETMWVCPDPCGGQTAPAFMYEAAGDGATDKVFVTVPEGYSGTVEIQVVEFATLDGWFDPFYAETMQVTILGGKEVPAAVDLGIGDLDDPRDIYHIPHTPFMLVPSHGTDSVAVINAMTLPVPVYDHSFPTYATGPAKIHCGVVDLDAQLRGDDNLDPDGGLQLPDNPGDLLP